MISICDVVLMEVLIGVAAECGGSARETASSATASLKPSPRQGKINNQAEYRYRSAENPHPTCKTHESGACIECTNACRCCKHTLHGHTDMKPANPPRSFLFAEADRFIYIKNTVGQVGECSRSDLQIQIIDVLSIMYKQAHIKETQSRTSLFSPFSVELFPQTTGKPSHMHTHTHTDPQH